MSHFEATKRRLMAEACEEFIIKLEEDGLLEEPTLFETLGEQAANHGRYLEAHQRGIQGTFITFRKIEVPHA